MGFQSRRGVGKGREGRGGMQENKIN
jgi:hypothetical protein